MKLCFCAMRFAADSTSIRNALPRPASAHRTTEWPDQVRSRRSQETGPSRAVFCDESLRTDRHARLLPRLTLSPLIGGFPTPARLRISSAFGILALAARSAKYSSVRNAETSSARATLMSWLSATPSAWANCRASFTNEGWSRSTKLLFLMTPSPSRCFETRTSCTPGRGTIARRRVAAADLLASPHCSTCQAFCAYFAQYTWCQTHAARGQP